MSRPAVAALSVLACAAVGVSCGTDGGEASPPPSAGPTATSGTQSPAVEGRRLRRQRSPEAAATDSATPEAEPRAGRQGRGLPKLGRDRDQEDVLVRLPGGDGSQCRDTDAHRDVRSGGFAAGPFDTVREEHSARYGDDRTVRLYLVPEHADEMAGVQVRATSRRGAAPVEVVQEEYADAEQFRFYDVDLPLAASGVWTIRAVSGPDRGCWVVDLG